VKSLCFLLLTGGLFLLHLCFDDLVHCFLRLRPDRLQSLLRLLGPPLGLYQLLFILLLHFAGSLGLVFLLLHVQFCSCSLAFLFFHLLLLGIQCRLHVIEGLHQSLLLLLHAFPEEFQLVTQLVPQAPGLVQGLRVEIVFFAGLLELDPVLAALLLLLLAGFLLLALVFFQRHLLGQGAVGRGLLLGCVFLCCGQGLQVGPRVPQGVLNRSADGAGDHPHPEFLGTSHSEKGRRMLVSSRPCSETQGQDRHSESAATRHAAGDV